MATTLTTAQLTRKVKFQAWVIRGQWLVLLFLIVFFIVLPLLVVLKKRKFSHNLTPVDTNLANSTIETYRKSFAYQRLSFSARPKVAGIVHDIAEWQDYITFFNTFRNYHSTVQGYYWKVGFYPGIFYDEGSRLGVYLIPTMVKPGINNNPDTILDYNDYKDSFYYSHKIINGDTTLETGRYVYDQGTIFP